MYYFPSNIVDEVQRIDYIYIFLYNGNISIYVHTLHVSCYFFIFLKDDKIRYVFQNSTYIFYILYSPVTPKKKRISKLVSNARIATSSKNRKFHAYRRSVNEMSNITRAGSTDLLLSRVTRTRIPRVVLRDRLKRQRLFRLCIDESYARIDPL